MLARLLSKIYKKNGIVLIDSQGQKYICGKPDLQKSTNNENIKKGFKLEIGTESGFEFSPRLICAGKFKLKMVLY